MKELKKYYIIIIVLICIINILAPIGIATEINKADLKYMYEIKTHIMYCVSDNWYEIKCGYVAYLLDGIIYPAYCVSHGLNGVDEEGDYSVTVNDILKDTLIYNIIRNGYPYKTPNQLGVETADDAYVATKQAIYSVILNRDVNNFYKAKDEKGEKIIKAIFNISEDGKKGNMENYESSCKVSKIDDFKEEKEYYYQEYSVTANEGIKEYNIENIEGFPEGTYISDKNGEKNTTFVGTENFRVIIPKDSLNKDINGSIVLNIISNANPIFFGEAPNEDLQNYAVTYKINTDYQKIENLNLRTNTATIKIIKRDDDSLMPIKNVEFGLYNENKELIITKKTNKTGIIEFTDLYQGKYFIKELKVDEYYIKDENYYEVQTKYNETIVKDIKNKHKKGNLQVTKVDKDDNSVTLEGIEFDLINNNDKQIIAHLITNEYGKAEIRDIDIGEYTLRETLTKREYNLCIDNNILVKWNETTKVLIENEKKKGQLEIYKTDRDNENIKLESVEFEILDENKKIVEKVITNKEGYAISSRLLIGKYYLKETKTLENYELETNLKEINIENNKITRLNITNNKIKGKIKIIKTSIGDSNLINARDGDRLENVCFEVYDSQDNLIETLITTEDGVAITKDLEKGRYRIIEKSTIKGFIIDNNEFFININKNNEIKELNIRK